MAKEKLREYYNIFTDCWKLFKKYAEQDPIEWQDLAKEIRNLRIKYKENKLLCDILLAIYREIERLEKNQNLTKKGVKKCD